MTAETGFVEKNTMLVTEFDKYILEHPEFAEEIPNDALVVMQIEGDESFNKWAREMAKGMADGEGAQVYVTVTELKPVRSRIEKLKIERAA
jgi:hypothetical protein